MSNDTRYKILIKDKNSYYNVGTIVIKKFNGEFMYIPSQKGILNNDSTIHELDHIFWHKSGRVHIKNIEKSISYDVREEGVGVSNPLNGYDKKRQSIDEIGFQKILKDTIINITSLPKYIKNIENIDIVFDIKDYCGPVQFNFSIASTSHILEAQRGGKTPVKVVFNKDNPFLLDNHNKCLGCESGNADKLLQYGLYKYTGEKVKTGRMLFLAEDSGIYKIKKE